MKKLKTFIISAAIAVFGVAAFAPAVTVSALDPLKDACANSSDNAVCDEVKSGSGNDLNDIIGIIVNTLLYVVGLLAVVMIIFSGIQYVSSTGDSGRVSKAKNTLTYSIVGLIVAVIAFALVNWVFDLF